MAEMNQKLKISGKKIAVFCFAAAAVLLLILEVTGIFGLLDGILNPEFSIKRAAAISYEVGVNPQITGGAGGFFLTTRDSMRFFNADGAEVFRDSHPFLNPVLFGRGGFAAILEPAGNVVQVYNTSGLLHRIVLDGPVISFSINCLGYFAVIIHRGGDIYDFRVYNNFGRLESYGPHADANIIPMLTDISPDGRFLAVSYLDITSAQLNSRINFKFTRQADYLAHDFTHGIFASSLSNPDQVIGAMRFMDNGNLAVISDTRIFAVEPSSGRTLWEISVGNRISQFYIGGDWILAAYGEALLNRQGRAAGELVAYDAQGREIFSLNVGVADSLAVAGNSGIVEVGGHFTAFNRDGLILWDFVLPNNVIDVAKIGADGFVAAMPVEAVIYRRIRN